MRGVKNNGPGKAGKPAGSRDLGKNNAWDIDTASGLRDRAEEKIRAVEAGGSTALQPGGKNQDLKKVIYELEVHQI